MLSSGLGEMGGAQPLAATMLAGSALVVDVDPAAIERRLRFGYLDETAANLDAASARIRDAIADRRPVSLGLLGNAAEIYPEVVRRGLSPDIVSDQTAAHDIEYGYIPVGSTPESAKEERQVDRAAYLTRVRTSIRTEAEAILALKAKGSCVFEYGNNFRAQAEAAGEARAFEIPGDVPQYIRPLFAVGSGPFRWVALSGNPRIFTGSTAPCSTNSPRMSTSPDGSASRRPKFVSKGFRPASPTWRMGSANGSAIWSMPWSTMVRSPLRWRSGGTTTTPEAWRVPIGRPRRCETARTPSPIGRS